MTKPENQRITIRPKIRADICRSCQQQIRIEVDQQGLHRLNDDGTPHRKTCAGAKPTWRK